MVDTKAQQIALDGIAQLENALKLQREAEIVRHDALLQAARARISLANDSNELALALDAVMSAMSVASW